MDGYLYWSILFFVILPFFKYSRRGLSDFLGRRDEIDWAGIQMGGEHIRILEKAATVAHTTKPQQTKQS